MRDLAPGVVAWHNASLVLDDVAFKNLQLLPRATEPLVQAASVALFPGAGILMQVRAYAPPPLPLPARRAVPGLFPCDSSRVRNACKQKVEACQSIEVGMQDVTFENNAVHGEPAGPREVATAKGSGAQGPPAVAFSVPKFLVWTWPGGPPAMTDSIDNSNKFAAGFLDGDAVLSGIQAVRLRQQQHWKERVLCGRACIGAEALPATVHRAQTSCININRLVMSVVR